MSEEKKRGRLTVMAFNAVLAAAFFFILQRFGLKASVETSLMWSVFAAAAAAMIAWKQSV